MFLDSEKYCQELSTLFYCRPFRNSDKENSVAQYFINVVSNGYLVKMLELNNHRDTGKIRKCLVIDRGFNRPLFRCLSIKYLYC